MKNIPVKTLSSAAIAALLLSPVAPYVAEAATPSEVTAPTDGFYVSNPNGNKNYFSVDEFFNSELEDTILDLINDAGVENVHFIEEGKIVNINDALDGADFADYEDQIPHGQYEKLDGSSTENVGEVAEEFKVLDISAINETSVTVSFPNDAGIEESDLTGQTITLTAGDSTLTATYKADSLNEDREATFSLSEGSSLVDATTYTVTGSLLKGSTEFVAETVDAYAKTFEASTKAIAAASTSKVYFSAKDQYGKDIVLDATTAKDLKVSATVNGVPLLNTGDNAEVKLAADFNSVEILKALKENDKVVVNVTNTVDKVDYKESFKYTVGEAEAAVETAFGSLTAKYVDKNGKAVETLSATDKATLTVPVLDQFGNPMEYAVEDVTTPVRWVVTKGKDLITPTTNGDKAVTDAKGEFKFTANKPGEVVVDAYLANGQTVQFSKVIAAEKLESINVDTTTSSALSKTKYNNESNVVAVLDAAPTSAMLNKEDIKLDVKPGKDLTAADIKTSVEIVTVGNGEAAKEVIVVKATTTKAGSYTVTPYIGEAVDAEGVIKGTDITFTTTLNPTVASFEVAPVKANEVTVSNTPVTKELVFKNKYGEVIKVAANKVTVASSDSDVATAIAEDKDGNAVLKITGKTEGTATVTVVSGAVSKQLTFDVVGAAKLDTVALGQAITKGVFAGTNKNVTQEVTLKDQFGNNFIPADDKLADIVITSDNSDLTAALQYYELDDKTGDKILQATTQNSDTVGVVLVVNANGVTLKEANTAETAKVTATVGDKEVSSVNVTIQPKAALNKVTATAKNTNVAPGAKTTVRVVPTNQYNEVIQNLTATEITLTAGSKFETPVTVTPVKEEGKTDGATIGYDVTLEAKAAAAVGAAPVEFNIVEVGKDVAKTASVNFNIVTASEVIDSVAIEQKDGVQDGKEDVQLKAVVKDSANQEVEVAESDLSWAIKGVKDADGNVLKGTWAPSVDAKSGTYTILAAENESVSQNIALTIKNGKITSDGNKLAGLTVDVTVEVESVNFKSAETTVTISADVTEYKKDFGVDKVYTGVITTDASKTDKEVEFNGTSVEITDVDSKKITFTFSGVNQYDKEFQIVEGVTAQAGSGALEVTTGNVTDEKAEQTLTIEALSAAGGKVFVKYGAERLTINVNLSDEVKALLEAEAAVVTAEETKTQANVDVAKGLVNALPEGTDKTNLLNTLNNLLAVTSDDTKTLAIANLGTVKGTEGASVTSVDELRFLVSGLEEQSDNPELMNLKAVNLSEVKTHMDKKYGVNFNKEAITIEGGNLKVADNILSAADWAKVKQAGNVTVPFKITVLKLSHTTILDDGIAREGGSSNGKRLVAAKIAMYSNGASIFTDITQ